MSWRDELRPGSFRNIPFVFIDGDFELGRRNVTHEYPLRDKPWIEDLGKKARHFSLTIYVLGDEYMVARDALIAAFEEEGSGELIHPRYGRLQVSVTACRQRETTAEGGYAQFNVTFGESGEKTFPNSKPDTPYQVEKAADEVIVKSVEEFEAGYLVDGHDVVQADALSHVRGIASDIAAINTKINVALQPLSDVAQALDELTEEAVELIYQPSNLASKMVSVVQTLVGGVVETGSALKGNLVGPRAARDAVQQLSKNTMTLVSKPDVTAPMGMAAEGNRAVMRRFVARVAEAEACRAVSKTEFDSYDESAGMRQSRYTGIEQLLTTAKTPLYQALLNLRSAMINDIVERGGDLARVGKYKPSSTVPALVLAHHIYGDATQADDIIKRNKVRHPGFVPGGELLEIVSE